MNQIINIPREKVKDRIYKYSDIVKSVNESRNVFRFFEEIKQLSNIDNPIKGLHLSGGLSTCDIDEILWLIGIWDNTKFDYFISGGFAVLYYGFPRKIKDIDVLVGLDSEELEERRKRSLILGLSPNSWLHIMLISKEDFSFGRKVRIEFNRKEINLVSAEDLIAHKLLLGREKDIMDIVGILIRQFEKLDFSYLRRRCQTLGIKLDNIRKLPLSIGENI